MRNGVDSEARHELSTQWRKLELTVNLLAVAAIPLALGIGGYYINLSLKRQDTQVKMIEIALGILGNEPKTGNGQDAFREWAVDVLDTYSSIKIPAKARAQLLLAPFPSSATSLTSLVDGSDVRGLVARVKFDGGSNDPNATDWGGGKPNTEASPLLYLEGTWAGRWNTDLNPKEWHLGSARFSVHRDYFTLIYTDPKWEYLMIGRQEPDGRLTGRHYNIANFRDTSPWVGMVVSSSRIDGRWRSGRWDFRRNVE